MPHPTQVVAHETPAAFLCAGRAETRREPREPLASQERRSIAEAEETEPAGTGAEGDEGWPRSNLVSSMVPMDVCGRHRNI